ncbi:hypothetical protein CALCODRAFT_498092 [Calocera cornea HHB12733]|uniref:F-box domain-containing protein n=1 Tax=Calocera cornea HHB12733 TaxID=1353952 RepID=A0A165EZV1_9BASI|nr:hypothetical protein CALCODRAFT_498092 [Calocera cornea HHB12733]
MHQAVFPNLGKLSIWITESPDLTARVIPFMSSGIFRLDIKCGEAVNDRSDWDKCLVPLLDHARQTCPNLEHLSFMGTGLRLLTTLDKAFSALIDSCTHLMQFDISNIALGPLTVRALARAPRLLSLTVDNQFGDDRQFELSSPDMQGFAQLRKLALKDISIHVATQFLEKVTWMLSELTIKVYNDELPFKSVQDLSVALNECGRSLRCTTIILVDKSNDRRRRPLSLYPAILQSLCQSNHMRELFLQVESPSAVDVRDTDLEKMALAWPDLRTFCMTWTPADKHPRRSGLPVAISRGGLWDEAALTLNSLVPFVEQCPKLEKFSLTSINADVPYRHRDLLPTGLQPLALHVGRAEIEDPDSVAEFLYSILPNVKLSHNGVGHRWSRWAEVQNKLSGLQAPQKDSGLSTDPPTN